MSWSECSSSLRRIMRYGSFLLTGAGEKAFAAGADINELRATDAKDRRDDGSARAGCVPADRDVREACHRIDQWLRARWRMRACDGVHDASGERDGEARATGDQARGYSGLWRVAAPSRGWSGTSAALKIMLTGEMVGAAEALRLGLVDRDGGPGTANRVRGEELGAAIAGAAPLAVAGLARGGEAWRGAWDSTTRWWSRRRSSGGFAARTTRRRGLGHFWRRERRSGVGK